MVSFDILPEGFDRQDAYVITCVEGPATVLIIVPDQGPPRVLVSSIVQKFDSWECLAR